MSAYFSGFSLGLSLILAIGSQNAFVLKLGIRRQYVFMICFLCAFSDAILIFLGVMGFGVVIQEYPAIETIARYGGAMFLFVYGIQSFVSAFTKSHALNDVAENQASRLKTALLCLAFTWLNPHVYLDTVILLGSVSTQYHEQRSLFAMGAMTASFVFFFSLGYGARILAPVFKNPRAWKILEFFVGCTMLVIGISLVTF